MCSVSLENEGGIVGWDKKVGQWGRESGKHDSGYSLSGIVGWDSRVG